MWKRYFSLANRTISFHRLRLMSSTAGNLAQHLRGSFWSSLEPMSIPLHPGDEDVFFFLVLGRNYLRLKVPGTFNGNRPLTLTHAVLFSSYFPQNDRTHTTPLHRKCSEFINEPPCVEGLTLLLRELQPQVSADVHSCKDKNDDINEREKKKLAMHRYGLIIIDN